LFGFGGNGTESTRVLTNGRTLGGGVSGIGSDSSGNNAVGTNLRRSTADARAARLKVLDNSTGPKSSKENSSNHINRTQLL
jgi:hypothetical protein